MVMRKRKKRRLIIFEYRLMTLFSIVDDRLQSKLRMIDQDMIKLKNDHLTRKNESEDEKINMKISVFDEM